MNWGRTVGNTGIFKQALLKSAAAELADAIVDVRVSAVLNKKQLHAAIRCSRLLTPREEDAIKQIVADRLDAFSVIQVSFFYGTEGQDISDTWKPLLLQRFLQAVPALDLWKEKLILEQTQDAVVFSAPKECLLFIRLQIQELERITCDIFSSPRRVVLEELDSPEEAMLPEKAGNGAQEINGDKTAAAVKVQIDSQAREKARKKETVSPQVLWGKAIRAASVQIRELSEDSGRVVVEGDLISINAKDVKDGTKVILLLGITDYTSSIYSKLFMAKEEYTELSRKVSVGSRLRIRGLCEYDKFQREIVLRADDINLMPKDAVKDCEPIKRVELHLHTQMSTMDALTNVKDLMKYLKQLGHSRVAVTDHGVVQAFPDAYSEGKSQGIDVIFGMEGYLVNDSSGVSADETFVVFDLETTGLDPLREEIIEIGAIKIRQGAILDSFSTFVNPKKRVPAEITKLTGITDDMVRNAPSLFEALGSFKNFCQNACLVAHNASFDMGFLQAKSLCSGLSFQNIVVDTLEIARRLLPELRSHKLNTLAKHYGIDMGSHHRAVDDANTAAQLLNVFMQIYAGQGITALPGKKECRETNRAGTYHVVLLAKNQEGLQNLYELVSRAHLENFYYYPRIYRSWLFAKREGLLIGSACHQGELYKAVLDHCSQEELDAIGAFYDYFEIQPLGNSEFLLREGKVKNKKELEDINRRIVELGRKLNKPVVATGDVHFLKAQDSHFRSILQFAQDYEDYNDQAPLYYRTTEEMLQEFSYLGEETARYVVVEAPNEIACKIESLRPFPDGTFAPKIEGAEDEIQSMAMAKAKEVYGDELPQTVKLRLEKELNAIINHGYAVLYVVAQKLVKKSLDGGYLVGSRGSVGSSFVAWLVGITEVNALPPHYVCPFCKRSVFIEPDGRCGVDLPPKECECGQMMKKDGYDIPFEVFLGFKGDKVPDIDLNFSGEYQSSVHKYVEELFGKDKVFRAGTISTLQEKTAYAYVMKYLEEKGIVASRAEIDRLVKGCAGVKRTTGQHPGGMVIVPKDLDIYQFTPIQHPADNKTSGIVTTHFDFNSLHDRLVKLDILGHDDPTALRMLQDITGLDPKTIPQDDPDTMAIFRSCDTLGITPEDIDCKMGTLGIPEFGTAFVRQMLLETLPTTMAELIRISGLSHGTDVWINNAQDIINEGLSTLSNVICTRDDIMNTLIQNGVDSKTAFDTMEMVRKGKGLKPEMEAAMKAAKLPMWFIDSCKKIKYMFPKAHAAAYVMMAFRIAYYKVHYPAHFYATYFTVKGDDFDALEMTKDRKSIIAQIKFLQSKGKDLSAKEEGKLVLLEVIREMYARGIAFMPVDLYESDMERFLINGSKLIPPLCTLPGVGKAALTGMVQARGEGSFLSLEDLRIRGKAGKTLIDALQAAGCLDALPQTSQISIFG
ncbi:MAG: PolC-type DNA polymerase III [Christensenellales bacterium]